MTETRNLGAMCAVAAALCAAAAAAGPSASMDPSPPAFDDRCSSFLCFLDRLETRLSNCVMRTSQRADDFIAERIEGREKRYLNASYVEERRMVDEPAGTRVAVAPGVELGEGSVIRLTSRIHANVDLPHLDRYVRLVVENSDEDEQVLSDFSRAGAPVPTAREDETRARLVAPAPAALKPLSYFSVGARFNPDPVLRISARARTSRFADPVLTRFTETVFHDGEDGFGEKSELDFIGSLSTNALLRATTAAIWSQTSQGVDLGQSFNFYHEITSDRFIGLKLGAEAHTDTTHFIDQFTLRMPYRQRLYKHFLFLEVEPGADFPQDKDYMIVPLVFVRVEFVFGTVRRPYDESGDLGIRPPKDG